MKGPLSLAGIGFVLAIAVVFRSGTNAHAQAPDPNHNREVTFNRDVAPIVFQSCARCHRPGESGPFPLLTYDDVKKRARQIRDSYPHALHAAVAARTAGSEICR